MAEEHTLQKHYDKIKEKILSITGNISTTTIQTLQEEISALGQLASLAGVNIDIANLTSILLVTGAAHELQKSKIIREIYNHYYNDQDKELPISELEKKQEAINKIYNASKSVYGKVLNEQRKDDENLQVLHKAIQEGRDLTKEEKKKLKKTPQEIEEAKARGQAIELANQLAIEEREHHSKKLQAIRDKKQNLPKEHPHRAVLAEREKHHQKSLDSAMEVIEQHDILHNERKQHAHNICLIQRLAKEKGCHEEFIQAFAANFQRANYIAPEELAKQLNIEGQKLQELIPLPSAIQDPSTTLEKPITLPHQQESKVQHFSKKTNKQGQDVDNMKHNFKQETEASLPGNIIIKPDQTPLNFNKNPIKEQGKGKAGRLP